MLNPYFTQGSNTEQDLVQDLVDEQIRMYGVDVHYIPRSYVTQNTVIKEVIQSEYKNAYPIEAYVSTYDGYEGAGTLLSKFGIQEQDDLTIVISRRRFENYLSPLLENVDDVKLSSRPKEGDLIYFPLGDRIFEIKYVEHESPFFQLKKNYVYELRCELYRLAANDVLDTGIIDIDDNIIEEGYIQTLQMVGLGSTASAITTIVNGGVRFVTITNRGSGYKFAPTVGFSSVQTGGVNAVGIASMIGGIIDFCDIDQQSLRVQSVEIINPGIGYTVPPMVSFIGGGGDGASATATIGDGIVGIITVLNGGGGYTSSPEISFSSPIGSGITAIATSKINSAGVVTSINIINAGLGYTQPPIITVGSPNIISGIGTYIFNEIIIGSESNSRARVRSWNESTKILEVASITDNFVTGELLIGQESGASYAINIINTDNLSDPSDPINIKDKYASNEDIELEAKKILDFSESNPFGNP